MKRSEINASIAWAKDVLDRNNIRLPETAYWPPEKWRAHADAIGTIRRAMLGWDITDFGTGDFARVGAVLYTVRNGLLADPSVGVPYCEKFIVMEGRGTDLCGFTTPASPRRRPLSPRRSRRSARPGRRAEGGRTTFDAFPQSPFRGHQSSRKRSSRVTSDWMSLQYALWTAPQVVTSVR